MPIFSVRADNFRNLSPKTIELHPHLNFLFGANASGKTSFLEAIYFLSSAKSFRTHKIQNIFKKTDDSEVREVLVFGSTGSGSKEGQDKQGVKKSIDGQTSIRMNGESLKSSAELARTLPVIVIEPRSFDLLVGGPKVRRKFLDWGVFHVEQDFPYIWKSFSQCLKQRNSVLRSGRIDDNLLNIWSTKLAHYGEQLSALRGKYLNDFEEKFIANLKEFGITDEIRISYYRGWDKDLPLESILGTHVNSDRDKGVTSYGPQRADLRIRLGRVNAAEVLSRGQQKLVVLALHLAHVQVLLRARGVGATVLIDDIYAELDKDNINRVFGYLKELRSQVVCTALALDVANLGIEPGRNCKLFHVEHGDVSEISETL